MMLTAPAATGATVSVEAISYVPEASGSLVDEEDASGRRVASRAVLLAPPGVLLDAPTQSRQSADVDLRGVRRDEV